MSRRDRNAEKVSAMGRLVDDFRAAKGVEPGLWPAAPKVATYVVIAAAVVALFAAIPIYYVRKDADRLAGSGIVKES